MGLVLGRVEFHRASRGFQLEGFAAAFGWAKLDHYKSRAGESESSRFRTICSESQVQVGLCWLCSHGTHGTWIAQETPQKETLTWRSSKVCKTTEKTQLQMTSESVSRPRHRIPVNHVFPMLYTQPCLTLRPLLHRIGVGNLPQSLRLRPGSVTARWAKRNEHWPLHSK